MASKLKKTGEKVAVIPLEDNFTDIVGKAQRGLNLSGTALAERAGVSLAEVNAVRRGEVDEAVLRKVAGALGLGAEALVASARGAWRPREVGEVRGLGRFNTPFDDMTVNAYVVYDAETREAAAFDTGADCDGMLEFAREKGLRVEMILLTHVHTDHVFDLGRLKAATGARAYVSGREVLAGAEAFEDGKIFEVGKLKIEARRTSGHARGGTSFVVTGLARRVALVGDALFAGSMGGGMVDYGEVLRTNREGIFTLPDETILCPGHGPLSTVGEEKLHNPFFPEFQQQQASQQ
ncbi:MAG TPA: MBL fold metallo-hydrolase [Verrucomicrobiae bacterium]|nr:MBL fold metallo-hydrolase [Verrucomicrobiae bacterium]